MHNITGNTANSPAYQLIRADQECCGELLISPWEIKCSVDVTVQICFKWQDRNCSQAVETIGQSTSCLVHCGFQVWVIGVLSVSTVAPTWGLSVTDKSLTHPPSHLAVDRKPALTSSLWGYNEVTGTKDTRVVTRDIKHRCSKIIILH